MLKIQPKALALFGALLLALGLWGCSPSTPPATPEVITVIQTQPVEVTRIVEIPQTVEVIREVMVTSVVEVPVTVTPLPTAVETATPTATATPEPTATPVITLVYTPAWFKTPPPGEKVPGISLLHVINETNQTLSVEISGPIYKNYTLSPGTKAVEILPEGHYAYKVYNAAKKLLYTGEMFISNPDKFQLKLREGKAVFWVP